MMPMMGMMSRVLEDLKAGRRNSSADMQRMRSMRDAAQQIMEHLNALMSEEAAHKGTLSDGAAIAPEPGVAHSWNEYDFWNAWKSDVHSSISQEKENKEKTQ